MMNQDLNTLFDQVRGFCKINTDRIFEEMEKHTMHAEEMARSRAESVEMVETIKNYIKRRRAYIWLEERSKSPKPPTIDDIKSTQELDPEIIELEDKLVVAMAARTYMDDMSGAFGNRSTMIVNLRKQLQAEVQAQ